MRFVAYRRLKKTQAINLYLPVLLEQGLATLVTMLGTILVSSVGAAAVSGVGLVDSVNYLFMNMLVAIGTGVTAIVSQCLGSGNKSKAGNISAHCITLSIYASVTLGFILIVFRKPLLLALFGSAEADVITSAADYLFFTALSLPLLSVFNVMSGIRRGTGDNLTPLLGSFLANVAYIIVSLICIHLLHLGVRGVGWGLLASRIISALVMIVVIIRFPRVVRIRRLPVKIDFKILKPVLNIAIPSALDSLVFNGGKVLVQVFMSGMGTASLAANSICNSLANFLQLPAKTLQITAVTLTGRAFGEGNFKKSRKIMLSQTYMSMITELFMCLGFYIAFTPLIHLFTYDSEIIAISRRLMYILYFSVPLLWAPSFVTPQALRATGDAKFTMQVSMFSMITCRIVGSWLLGVYFNMGIAGIWLAMILDWLLRSAFYIPRVFSHKWEHTIE